MKKFYNLRARKDSNKPDQLQRLASSLNFACIRLSYYTFWRADKKVLICLCISLGRCCSHATKLGFLEMRPI